MSSLGEVNNESKTNLNSNQTITVYLISDIHVGDNILYKKKKALVQNLVQTLSISNANNYTSNGTYSSINFSSIQAQNNKTYSNQQIHTLVEEKKISEEASQLFLTDESADGTMEIGEIVNKDSNYISNSNIVVIAGDLTHNGYGDAQFACFSCCLCSNTGCSKPNSNSSKSDELSMFDIEIYQPIKKVNPIVLMCHGNHDESTDNMSYPVVDFIKRTTPNRTSVTKEGYYYYIESGVVFMVLGKYPSFDALKYFDSVHKKLKGAFPYVVVFHYQISELHGHDFWTKAEKIKFSMFLDNKKIICIMHGHIHFTYGDVLYTVPSNTAIPVFCGGGEFSYYRLMIKDNKCIECKEISV